MSTIQLFRYTCMAFSLASVTFRVGWCLVAAYMSTFIWFIKLDWSNAICFSLSSSSMQSFFCSFNPANSKPKRFIVLDALSSSSSYCDAHYFALLVDYYFNTSLRTHMYKVIEIKDPNKSEGREDRHFKFWKEAKLWTVYIIWKISKNKVFFFDKNL